MKQQVTQKHEQFTEQQQRDKNQPEFAPQQSAQRDRRALQNPESFPFQADRRKSEANGDGAEHRAGERQIGKGNNRPQRSRGHRRTIQRQNFEVIKINDDQREQKEQLGPLGRVAQKSLDVLDHDRACGFGKQARSRIEQAIEPYQFAAPLTGLLRFRPPFEINRAGDPRSGDGKKQRVARQQSEEETLFGFPVEQRPSQNFRSPTAR